jgi:hypothetical protein
VASFKKGELNWYRFALSFLIVVANRSHAPKPNMVDHNAIDQMGQLCKKHQLLVDGILAALFKND